MKVVFNQSHKPLEEKEYPDEADLAAEDDEQTLGLMACPQCGRLVYEEAAKCPYCGEWIVQPGGRWRQSRKWYVRGGLYLIKTILINWIFLLALLAISSAVALWKLYLQSRSR